MNSLVTTLITFVLASILASSLRANTLPNLVVFISDDHGYLDSTVAGDERFETPNMDRLKQRGMTFTQAFAPSPSCAPSRAALLTGLMPARNGAIFNHQPPRDEIKKLPVYLHELGYEVVAFGKVAHYKQGKKYGFDLVAHDTFHDHKCIPAALKYLSSWKGEKPLCMMVGTNWPHVPWPETSSHVSGPLPPKHIDTPDTRAWRGRYAAAVARMDIDLGKVYDAAFDRLGPNTLFIHFSDHGSQWPFGKWNLYDTGSRVPFFAVWPDVIEPGSQTDAMVSLVDVLPTLIEFAGGRPPKDIDGRSFRDVLLGKKAGHRDRVFTTHSGDGKMNEYPIRAVRTPRWKYIRNLRPDAEHHTHIDRGKSADGSGYWQSWVEKATSDSSSAAIVESYFHRPAEELYDLENDPHELVNLAGDERYVETLAGLRAEVDEWMREQGDEGN